MHSDYKSAQWAGWTMKEQPAGSTSDRCESGGGQVGHGGEEGRLYTGSVELTTLAKNTTWARLFSKLSIKNRLSILPRVVRGGGEEALQSCTLLLWLLCTKLV